MTDQITSILDEIEKRADAATEAPWIDCPLDRNCNAWVRNEESVICRITFAVDPDAEGNKQFITNARTDVPRLAKALRVAVEAMKSVDGDNVEAVAEAALAAIQSILNGESK